jgi:lipopolysaccharide transport protein LptA
VAPFSGESTALPVSEALAARLARRPIERLIPPDGLVAEPGIEPPAADVRRWAFNAAVDAVVVGELRSQAGPDGEGPIRVEAAVRSGHSGAELFRHDVVMERPADLGSTVEALAVTILVGLGYADAGVGSEAGAGAAADAAGAVSARPIDGGGGGATESGSGRGLDTEFALPGFENDAPIEIQADEAEILDLEDHRQLIFQKNVRVRQANITLRTDRLEAEYLKGESEPVRLVARGAVRVDQGDRRARCDEAVYVRADQLLICRGHAELVQGCDIVRGESIEFDLERDKARVDGAASIVIRPKQEEQGPAAPCEGSPEGKTAL